MTKMQFVSALIFLLCAFSIDALPIPYRRNLHDDSKIGDHNHQHSSHDQVKEIRRHFPDELQMNDMFSNGHGLSISEIEKFLQQYIRITRHHLNMVKFIKEYLENRQFALRYLKLMQAAIESVKKAQEIGFESMERPRVLLKKLTIRFPNINDRRITEFIRRYYSKDKKTLDFFHTQLLSGQYNNNPAPQESSKVVLDMKHDEQKSIPSKDATQYDDHLNHKDVSTNQQESVMNKVDASPPSIMENIKDVNITNQQELIPNDIQYDTYTQKSMMKEKEFYDDYNADYDDDHVDDQNQQESLSNKIDSKNSAINNKNDVDPHSNINFQDIIDILKDYINTTKHSIDFIKFMDTYSNKETRQKALNYIENMQETADIVKEANTKDLIGLARPDKLIHEVRKTFPEVDDMQITNYLRKYYSSRLSHSKNHNPDDPIPEEKPKQFDPNQASNDGSNPGNLVPDEKLDPNQVSNDESNPGNLVPDEKPDPNQVSNDESNPGNLVPDEKPDPNQVSNDESNPGNLVPDEKPDPNQVSNDESNPGVPDEKPDPNQVSNDESNPGVPDEKPDPNQISNDGSNPGKNVRSLPDEKPEHFDPNQVSNDGSGHSGNLLPAEKPDPNQISNSGSNPGKDVPDEKPKQLDEDDGSNPGMDVPDEKTKQLDEDDGSNSGKDVPDKKPYPNIGNNRNKRNLNNQYIYGSYSSTEGKGDPGAEPSTAPLIGGIGVVSDVTNGINNLGDSVENKLGISNSGMGSSNTSLVTVAVVLLVSIIIVNM